MTVAGGVPEPGAPGQHRIGDAERAAATEALDAHREAGRLDATEYEDRQVAVSRARTWSEIQPLFRDLPAPHPAGMPAVPQPGVPAPMAGQPGPVPLAIQADSQGLLGGIVPPRYRETVMALTPFAALALFFLTKQWWMFLAIPVMAILLYGAGGNEQRKIEERRRLEERRAARDLRRDLRRDRRRGRY